MQIKSIEPYSFKGRLYLNKNDLSKCKNLTYEKLRDCAKGQVIESARKDGFIWVRLEGTNEKKIVKQCQCENLLFYHIPGDISYSEFEKFAHTNW